MVEENPTISLVAMTKRAVALNGSKARGIVPVPRGPGAGYDTLWVSVQCF